MGGVNLFTMSIWNSMNNVLWLSYGLNIWVPLKYALKVRNELLESFFVGTGYFVQGGRFYDQLIKVLELIFHIMICT